MKVVIPRPHPSGEPVSGVGKVSTVFSEVQIPQNNSVGENLSDA